VSEETEAASDGPEGNGAAIDPTAIALALAGASPADANAFLKDQRALIAKHCALADDQRQHLHEQLKNLRLTIWEKRAGLLLRVATAVMGLGVACFLGVVVWNAAHADGLVIESFNVPPDLAQRGLNGEVVASKTLDELTNLSNATTSYRAAKTYSNNWGDDIKVEIPETGISVGEVYRFLKNWLGHETHISGEIYRISSGIAITARISGGSGFTVRGGEEELDALIARIAERIYASTQTFRYTNYLVSHGRSAEAIPINKAAIASGSNADRAWAYLGLHVAAADSTDVDGRVALLQNALSLQPDNGLTLSALCTVLFLQGRDEQAIEVAKRLQSILQAGNGGLAQERVAALQKTTDARISLVLGDFRPAARDQAEYIRMGGITAFQSSALVEALAETGAHDLRAARTTMTNPPQFVGTEGATELTNLAMQMRIDNEAGDFQAAVSRAETVGPLIAKYPALRTTVATTVAPALALAQANLGNIGAAEGIINATPQACYLCVRIRSRIAALRGQSARANFWYARAAAIGPSMPFAHSEWGRALLDQGQPDDAIAKFTLANKIGPHYADPLEGWGEALMAKNQSHLALVKFAEAEKYAPNWGRLHLKWGEALVYAGKTDEAKLQFARAAQFDLTPSEKAEMARFSRG
jgi:tetratricopeptide (TPR) repeat protein